MSVPASAIAALRLDLTNCGLKIEDSLLNAGFGLLLANDQASEGLSEGLDLILPGGYWTNVTVSPRFARHSPWQLGAVVGRPERLVLRHKSQGEVPVSLPDTSRFRHQRIEGGISCGEVGAVHGRWVVVAPIASRGPVGLDHPRRFLGVPQARAHSKGQWSVDEVVTCVEAAWRHAGVRMVHLEASHLLRADGGLADLSPYLQALSRSLPVLISLSVLPPEDPTQVLELYAAGADAVSYHLLAWDEEALVRVAPLRTRFVSQARVLAALDAAARYFPRGAASTDLLLGLEPLQQVEAACRELTRRGVVPNISLFRPLPGAEDEAPPAEALPREQVLALMAQRGELLRSTGLAGTRVRGFPRVLAGADRYLPGLFSRSYASMRRSLRVQPV